MISKAITGKLGRRIAALEGRLVEARRAGATAIPLDLSHLSDDELEAIIAGECAVELPRDSKCPKPTEAELQAILRKLGSPPDWSRLTDAELGAIIASEESAG